MQKLLVIIIWLISTCCFSNVFAMFYLPADGFAISGEIAASKLHIGDSTLAVTPTETDTLHEEDNPFVPEFSVGLNYTVPLYANLKWGRIHFFPYLQPALNLRYLKQTINGEVYQYQEANMNNYNYTLTLDSLRLMVDLKVALLTIDEKLQLYLLGGIGDVWNQLSYEDTPIPGVEGGSLSLNNRTTSGFVYELGAGILYPINCFMSIFFEYRYAKFPTLHTSGNGTLDGEATQIPSVSFPFSSNTLSFGINWKI